MHFSATQSRYNISKASENQQLFFINLQEKGTFEQNENDMLVPGYAVIEALGEPLCELKTYLRTIDMLIGLVPAKALGEICNLTNEGFAKYTE